MNELSQSTTDTEFLQRLLKQRHQSSCRLALLVSLLATLLLALYELGFVPLEEGDLASVEGRLLAVETVHGRRDSDRLLVTITGAERPIMIADPLYRRYVRPRMVQVRPTAGSIVLADVRTDEHFLFALLPLSFDHHEGVTLRIGEIEYLTLAHSVEWDRRNHRMFSWLLGSAVALSLLLIAWTVFTQGRCHHRLGRDVPVDADRAP